MTDDKTLPTHVNNSRHFLPKIKVLRVDSSEDENIYEVENAKSNQRITIIFMFNRIKRERSAAEKNVVQNVGKTLPKPGNMQMV